MATLTQPNSATGATGNSGMEELLPLVKALTDPEQVRKYSYCCWCCRELVLWNES
jgi:hypothetical protein